MRKMKPIWAVKCPELRADMVEWMTRPDMDGAAAMLAYMIGDVNTLLEYGPTDADERLAQAQARRGAASLTVAELFHITHKKMPEVLEAAAQLPKELEVKRHWFHADHGVMFFERGYVSKAFDDRDYEWEGQSKNQVHIMALSWSITGDLVRVFAWADTDTFVHLAADHARAVRLREEIGQPVLTTESAIRRRIANVGPLMACGQLTARLGTFLSHIGGSTNTANMMEGDGYSHQTMAILLTACLMLRQYTTAASVVEAPRSSWKRIQRMNPDLGRKVTVIDKRTIRPNPTKEVAADAPKRQLSVRYDRRGHWREYKHEKFSPELREHPIWIPAHWVGDEGLPLVQRHKVTRLKR